MNDVFQSALPPPPRFDFDAFLRFFRFSSRLLGGGFLAPALFAQTVVTISNPSFEDPTPTVFDDYTVGASGWTRTSPTINAGTFDPTLSGRSA